MALHWERGYRMHGLWDDDNNRYGCVGLSARSPNRSATYVASVDARPAEWWEYQTLTAAKRRVERELVVPTESPEEER